MNNNKGKYFQIIKNLIPKRLRYILKRILVKDPLSLSKIDRHILHNAPKLHRMKVSFLNGQLELTDPFWFLFTYQEIFIDQIYKFEASRENPLIIDCGSNIGLSLLYFKYLYPNAIIKAFEPDPSIFQVLQRNVCNYQLNDIELNPYAVWKSSEILDFQPDGSVGGRIISNGTNSKQISVQAIRLADFLNQYIDLLKLDIEGAELEVIQDCQNYLDKIEHIFIEYHGSAKQPQKLHILLKILSDAGFRYHIKDAHPIKHPFISNERNTLYDLQLNIFGFR